MQDMNQLFSFAMRMPRQRLAQELVKPTGMIPPAIAMAALQKMNSVHAAPAQGPTMAQQMAQAPAPGGAPSGEMQAFASGGIVKLAEGGGNRWWEGVQAWDRGYPTERSRPFSPNFSVAEYLNSDEFKNRTKDREMSHRTSRTEDDGTATTAPREFDVVPPAEVVGPPAGAAGGEAKKDTAKPGEGKVSGIEDYFKRISGLLPDRYAGYEAGLGALNKELARQRANVVPTALMTAGANMIGRRTPYATEAMGEGARAGLGAFVTGQDAQRKAQMDALAMEGSVAGTRSGIDAGVAGIAQRDRQTDEIAEARVLQGALGRENANAARIEQVVNGISNNVRQRVEELMKTDYLTITDPTERRRIELMLFNRLFQDELSRRPAIAAYLRGSGEGGGSASGQRPGPASGGTPVQPGK